MAKLVPLEQTKSKKKYPDWDAGKELFEITYLAPDWEAPVWTDEELKALGLA